MLMTRRAVFKCTISSETTNRGREASSVSFQSDLIDIKQRDYRAVKIRLYIGLTDFEILQAQLSDSLHKLERFMPRELRKSNKLHCLTQQIFFIFLHFQTP